jgi:hypothetical protein
MLMPEEHPDNTYIMVATGTGIAPFRSFWRRCFYENVPGYKFTGLFWLFMGVANSDAKLYDNELNEILATYPENFRVDYALSREQNSGRLRLRLAARLPQAAAVGAAVQAAATGRGCRAARGHPACCPACLGLAARQRSWPRRGLPACSLAAWRSSQRLGMLQAQGPCDIAAS